MKDLKALSRKASNCSNLQALLGESSLRVNSSHFENFSCKASCLSLLKSGKNFNEIRVGTPFFVQVNLE